MDGTIADYLKSKYQLTLEKRYADLKAILEEENFTPDSGEVWKMYERAFAENHGMCIMVEELLGLELYDKTGRLNELHIILDKANRKISDYCSAYIAGINKNYS